MEREMPQRKFLIGRFQKKIIFITFIPVVAISLFAFFIIVALYSALFSSILSESSIPYLLQNIQRYSYIAVGVLILIFIVILSWVYVESSMMVSALDRLMKELDEFDPNRKGWAFHVRKDDTLAKEIASRINKILG